MTSPIGSPLSIVFFFAMLAYSELHAYYAHKRGIEVGKGMARCYTFTAEKEHGEWFFKKTRVLYLSVTVVGDEVKHLAGNLSDIERFAIPPEIKKLIYASLAIAKVGGGASP